MECLSIHRADGLSPIAVDSALFHELAPKSSHVLTSLTHVIAATISDSINGVITTGSLSA